MQMIDQSASSRNNGGSSNSKKQVSPEVLGPRQNRKRRLQGNEQSSRHLNFKDISPLVKSCNTFVFENAVPS